MHILYAIIGIPLGLLFFAAIEKGGDAIAGMRVDGHASRPKVNRELEKLPRRKQVYYCTGRFFSGQGPYSPAELAEREVTAQHTHATTAEAHACGERWIADEKARAARPRDVGVPCPACHRNHFGSMCPGEYKARVTEDGDLQYISMATGEVHDMGRP